MRRELQNQNLFKQLINVYDAMIGISLVSNIYCESMIEKRDRIEMLNGRYRRMVNRLPYHNELL